MNFLKFPCKSLARTPKPLCLLPSHQVKSVQLADSVVFWRWVGNDRLGLVTATAVFHWDMTVSHRPDVGGW